MPKVMENVERYEMVRPSSCPLHSRYLSALWTAEEGEWEGKQRSGMGTALHEVMWTVGCGTRHEAISKLHTCPYL